MKSALFRSSCKNDLKRANASEFRGGGCQILRVRSFKSEPIAHNLGGGVSNLGGGVYFLLLSGYFCGILVNIKISECLAQKKWHHWCD